MKKQIAGIICLLSAVVMVFSIGRAIPYGLSGNIASAKPYFALMAIAFIIGLPFAVIYQYYRNIEQGNKEL